MKTKIFFILICNLIICNLINAQSINGKLGTGGQFIIRDTSSTFMTLNQSNGNITFFRSVDFTDSVSNSSAGVFTKNGRRFFHNYQNTGTNGFNTFAGLGSGNFTMSGGSGIISSYLTAVGYNSLQSVTTGYYNSAFGSFSLTANTTGNSNSGFGTFSLSSNISGSENTAFGSVSLMSSISGSQNSGFGSQSLRNNSTGTGNSGFGKDALRNNILGSYNSAFGTFSLSNITGNFNTGFGSSSLGSLTSGNENTALGSSSGNGLSSGSNNIVIGYNAQLSSNIVSNEITFGDNRITTLRCNVQSITSLSDERDKKNIAVLSLGLDFIAKLKPRQFNWDKREWYEGNLSDGTKQQELPAAGFIAQELDDAQISAHAEWLNLVMKNNPDKLEATYGNLLPVMVKAIQELKSENDGLKTKNDLLEERLTKFEQAQNILAGEISKLKAKIDVTEQVNFTNNNEKPGEK